MNKEQILSEIKHLAKHQGFYKNLYLNLMESPENMRESYLQNLEDEKFEDTLEMSMFLESEIY